MSSPNMVFFGMRQCDLQAGARCLGSLFPPDGLLTLGQGKQDVGLEYLSLYSCTEEFTCEDNDFIITKTEEINTMITGEDESSPGLNARLRPRKSVITTPSQNKSTRKSEGKLTEERSKKTTTPSKAITSNQDDLTSKSEPSPAPLLLCPYCDRKFTSKQTVSKHARRIHLSTTSKQDNFIKCLFCNHSEAESNEIIKHMVNNHPNQYFACLECFTRFSVTTELAEHKHNVCEKQKPSYRSKLRQKSISVSKRKTKRSKTGAKNDIQNENTGCGDDHRYNGIVISCELKPSQTHDAADIEDNLTTNLILPHTKALGKSVMEKNAVIVLDDIQWNKRMPPNFSFHNTDADQILTRLGVVHRSPRVGESNRKELMKIVDESSQKFERCFDTSFYSKVAKNVQENLAKYLDGSINFNPNKENTIKTRKSKTNVVINTAEGFPILLAYEQYSRNLFDGYMPRALAPKHKWKWDNAESDKNVVMLINDSKRNSHVNNCIITLVSSLDIWTQLQMRRKFEDIYKITPTAKKTEKQNMISRELKEILESRDIPSNSTQLVACAQSPVIVPRESELPAHLGLLPVKPKCELQPAVLSGEWVRPRRFVCCACGEQTNDMKTLCSHVSAQHPNAQVQHYEIVGETLLSADILKHLYVPPSPMSNRTRPLRGIRDCTKCEKSITLEDLHQHMLDCAGDTPTIRRKCRYRPFGVRRRRTRLPDNSLRKKMRNNVIARHRQKGHMRTRPRPRPKIRTEVGDAETIRKMIADLPAKRNRSSLPILRPRRNIRTIKKTIKLRSSDDAKAANVRTGKKICRSKKTTALKKQQEGDSSRINVDDDDQPIKSRADNESVKNAERKAASNEGIENSAGKKYPKNKKVLEGNNDKLDNVNKELGIGQPDTELSMQCTPRKIDVHGAGPSNVRQHSNRSNSREERRDRRPKEEKKEENLDNHNITRGPNIPSKQRIDSSTRRVESLDQNLVSNDRILVAQQVTDRAALLNSDNHQTFENETVGEKFDKPPLWNDSKDSSCNVAKDKSKSIKSKKGLEHCIAMLKTKKGLPESTKKESIKVNLLKGNIENASEPDQKLEATNESLRTNRSEATAVSSKRTCGSSLSWSDDHNQLKTPIKNKTLLEEANKSSEVVKGTLPSSKSVGQNDSNINSIMNSNYPLDLPPWVPSLSAVGEAFTGFNIMRRNSYDPAITPRHLFYTNANVASALNMSNLQSVHPQHSLAMSNTDAGNIPWQHLTPYPPEIYNQIIRAGFATETALSAPYGQHGQIEALHAMAPVSRKRRGPNKKDLVSEAQKDENRKQKTTNLTSPSSLYKDSSRRTEVRASPVDTKEHSLSHDYLTTNLPAEESANVAAALHIRRNSQKRAIDRAEIESETLTGENLLLNKMSKKSPMPYCPDNTNLQYLRRHSMEVSSAHSKTYNYDTVMHRGHYDVETLNASLQSRGRSESRTTTPDDYTRRYYEEKLRQELLNEHNSRNSNVTARNDELGKYLTNREIQLQDLMVQSYYRQRSITNSKRDRDSTNKDLDVEQSSSNSHALEIGTQKHTRGNDCLKSRNRKLSGDQLTHSSPSEQNYECYSGRVNDDVSAPDMRRSQNIHTIIHSDQNNETLLQNKYTVKSHNSTSESSQTSKPEHALVTEPYYQRRYSESSSIQETSYMYHDSHPSRAPNSDCMSEEISDKILEKPLDLSRKDFTDSALIEQVESNYSQIPIYDKSLSDESTASTLPLLQNTEDYDTSVGRGPMDSVQVQSFVSKNIINNLETSKNEYYAAKQVISEIEKLPNNLERDNYTAAKAFVRNTRDGESSSNHTDCTSKGAQKLLLSEDDRRTESLEYPVYYRNLNSYNSEKRTLRKSQDNTYIGFADCQIRQSLKPQGDDNNDDSRIPNHSEDHSYQHIDGINLISEPERDTALASRYVDKNTHNVLNHDVIDTSQQNKLYNINRVENNVMNTSEMPYDLANKLVAENQVLQNSKVTETVPHLDAANKNEIISYDKNTNDVDPTVFAYIVDIMAKKDAQSSVNKKDTNVSEAQDEKKKKEILNQYLAHVLERIDAEQFQEVLNQSPTALTKILSIIMNATVTSPRSTEESSTFTKNNIAVSTSTTSIIPKKRHSPTLSTVNLHLKESASVDVCAPESVQPSLTNADHNLPNNEFCLKKNSTAANIDKQIEKDIENNICAQSKKKANKILDRTVKEGSEAEINEVDVAKADLVSNINKEILMPHSNVLPSNESNQDLGSKAPAKAKHSNEQTASLRAVRIKTPSRKTTHLDEKVLSTFRPINLEITSTDEKNWYMDQRVGTATETDHKYGQSTFNLASEKNQGPKSSSKAILRRSGATTGENFPESMCTIIPAQTLPSADTKTIIDDMNTSTDAHTLAENCSQGNFLCKSPNSSLTPQEFKRKMSCDAFEHKAQEPCIRTDDLPITDFKNIGKTNSIPSQNLITDLVTHEADIFLGGITSDVSPADNVSNKHTNLELNENILPCSVDVGNTSKNDPKVINNELELTDAYNKNNNDAPKISESKFSAHSDDETKTLNKNKDFVQDTLEETSSKSKQKILISSPKFTLSESFPDNSNSLKTCAARKKNDGSPSDDSEDDVSLADIVKKRNLDQIAEDFTNNLQNIDQRNSFCNAEALGDGIPLEDHPLTGSQRNNPISGDIDNNTITGSSPERILVNEYNVDNSEIKMDVHKKEFSFTSVKNSSNSRNSLDDIVINNLNSSCELENGNSNSNKNGYSTTTDKGNLKNELLTNNSNELVLAQSVGTLSSDDYSKNIENNKHASVIKKNKKQRCDTITNDEKKFVKALESFDKNLTETETVSYKLNNSYDEENFDTFRLQEVKEIMPSLELNCATNAVENYSNDKAYTTLELNLSNESQNCKLNSLPLRRSRRGKSMYLDNIPVEESIDYVLLDESDNKKMPLTMKRLILSRVEKDKNGCVSIPSTHCDLNISREDVEHIDNIQVQLNTIKTIVSRTKKSKPLKRKQSSHSRRKTKKYKSLNKQQSDYASADDGNSHEIETLESDSEKKIEDVDKYRNNVDLISTSASSVMENVMHVDEEPSKTVPINDSPKVLSGKRKKSIGKTTVTKQKKTKYSKAHVYSDFDSEDEKDLTEIKQKQETDTSIKNESIIESSMLIGKRDIIVENSDNQKNLDSNPDLTVVSNVSGETRTTCYNRYISNKKQLLSPVSKKEPGNYDPYNIDFEDMIETTTPLLKKRRKNAKKINHENKAKQKLDEESDKNISALKNVKEKMVVKEIIIKNDVSDSDSDSSKSDVPLQKYVDEKNLELGQKNKNDYDETVGVNLHYSYQPIINPSESTSTQISDHVKQDIISSNDEAFNSNDPVLPRDDNTICEDEVVQLNRNLNTNNNICTSHLKQKQSKEKKNRRTLSAYNDVDPQTVLSETDQQLRSDKFMENFGFYSERIPRKSNLLASKKISETFHMISNESDDSSYLGYKETKIGKKSAQIEKKNSEDPSISQESPSSAGSNNIDKKNYSTSKLTPDEQDYVSRLPCSVDVSPSHSNVESGLLISEFDINREVPDATTIQKYYEMQPHTSGHSVSQELSQNPKESIGIAKDIDKKTIKSTTPKDTDKQIVIKSKMYPDIEEIDLLEDKFDKIKRKRRSQAVAAKQIQNTTEANTSNKSRKRPGKKKTTKNAKKKCPNTQVPTKGALKGFESIKISIPTQDLNMPPHVSPPRLQKKRRRNKRRKGSGESGSSCSEYEDKVKSLQDKDVYEFKDNEDTELLELRPSTVMDRFRSIHNKIKLRNKDKGKVDKEKRKDKEKRMESKGKHAKEVKEKLKILFSPETCTSKGQYVEDNLKHVDIVTAESGDTEHCVEITSDVKSTTMTEESSSMINAEDVGHMIDDSAQINLSKELQNDVYTDSPVPGTSGFVPDGDDDESDYESESSITGGCIVYKSDEFNCLCRSDMDSDDSDAERVCGKSNCIYRNRNADKNTAIGNIFKNNAVRRDKSDTEDNDLPKPDLDQLFDSLLETRVDESELLNQKKSNSDKQSLSSKVLSRGENGKRTKKAASIRSTSVMNSPVKESDYLSTRRNSNSIDIVSNKPDEVSSSSSDDSSSAPDHNFDTLENELNIPTESGVYSVVSTKSTQTGGYNSTNFDLTNSDVTGVINKNSNANDDEDDINAKESDDWMDVFRPGSKRSGSELTKLQFNCNEHINCNLDCQSAFTKYMKDISPSEICLVVSTRGCQTVILDRQTHEVGTECLKNIKWTLIKKKFCVETSEESTQTEINYEDMDINHDEDSDDNSFSERDDESEIFEGSVRTDCKINKVHRGRNSHEKKNVSEPQACSSRTPIVTTEVQSPSRKSDEGISTSHDCSADAFDQTPGDSGVARQRARRKCTVGKQNVLAEHWSSESETEDPPPRRNSADSVAPRKKRGKKKEHSGKKGRHGAKKEKKESECVEEEAGPSRRVPGPKMRAWARHHYWSSDTEDAQPQHGWIVGDSHKKLVTMLAHAKGSRHYDDEQHLDD